MPLPSTDDLARLADQYPDKFVPPDRIFSHIRRGDRLFVGTGCGEPQHLTLIARKQGLHGFTAEVLRENEPMLRVFEKMRFPMESRLRDSVYELTISLK